MLTLFVMAVMAGSPLQMPPAPKPFPVEYVEASYGPRIEDEDE